MPSEINVAIIGLGGKGGSHASNLAKLPGVRIAALGDVNPEAVARCRAAVGEAAAGAYGTADVDRIFADPHIDAVVIATHHDSHTRLAVAAAEAKKHLLVEKPLALTLEECRAIEQAVDANGVQLVMGFQARHRHFVQVMKGRFPRPRVVIGQIIDPKWPDGSWLVDPVRGGGNVLSQGVHTFDLVCYLAGSEPVSIHAVGGVFVHDPRVTPTVDTCLGTIQFASGAVASVNIGDFGPLPWPRDKSFYQVFDTRDRSATLCDARLLLASGGFLDERQVEEHDIDGPSGEDRPDHGGTLSLVAEFVNCARENKPPKIGANAREGRRATTLALMAFESMSTGTIQQVD